MEFNIKKGTKNKHALETKPMLVSNLLMDMIGKIIGKKASFVKNKRLIYIKEHSIESPSKKKTILSLDTYEDFINFTIETILTNGFKNTFPSK